MAALVIRSSARLLRKTGKRAAFGRLVADQFDCWHCFQGVLVKRYLLTEDIVQLRKFQEKKLEAEYKTYGRKDAFFRTVEEKLAKNTLILRNELVNVLHLCQSKNEIELAKRIIYRYHAENRNMAFGEFRFGPLFMRLCYELDLEATALELIKDQALHGFFGDSTSFNILMDLLFVKGRYTGRKQQMSKTLTNSEGYDDREIPLFIRILEDALEVLLEMKKQNVKFNQDTYLLAFAICYKLNSPESCNIFNSLLEDTQLQGFEISRRAHYFATAFALKQNDILKAHYWFSKLIHTESRICDNLKILLLAASGNPENLVQMLGKASNINAFHFVRKPSFCLEVMNAAREKLKSHPALSVQFEEIFVMLQASGQIVDLTLDDILCQAPRSKQRPVQLLKEMKRSQRTMRPLHSSLMAD